MVACNDAFVRLLGYATKADVLGLNAREFYVDPGDRDAWLALIRPGAAVMNHETVWRRHDGTRIVVLLNVEEREDDLIEGIALDITDRKRAEDAERRAIELRAITKLANAAAHEINNPLSVLLVDVTRMAREGDPRPQLRRMEEAARRIRDIVRRMLAITRVATFEDDPLLPPMLDIRRSSDDEKEP
jgi:PAS domain S-box-containing protein